MRKSMSFILVLVLLLSFSALSFAAGMPAAHGLNGRDFGAAVSSLEPGAIADHVSMGSGMGMPALHGVDGRTFGGLVSGLEPGSIADHVRGGK